MFAGILVHRAVLACSGCDIILRHQAAATLFVLEEQVAAAVLLLRTSCPVGGSAACTRLSCGAGCHRIDGERMPSQHLYIQLGNNYNMFKNE